MQPRAAVATVTILVGLVWQNSVLLAQRSIGPPQQVNPNHAGLQQGVSVALAQDGRALAVYGGDNSGNKRVRTLDRWGLPFGPEQSLHLLGEVGFPFLQSLALQRQGQGVVCWAGGGPCLCRLAEVGGALGSREIFCSDTWIPMDLELDPVVATFGDGGFVVVWYLFRFGSSSGDPLFDVVGRFFTRDGTPRGGSVTLARDLRDPMSTTVTALGDDRAAFVWGGVDLDGSGNGLRGRIVTGDGEFVGEEFAVTTYTADDQIHAASASNGADRFVVVWESLFQDDSFGGIYGQLFDAEGGRIGPEFQISSDADSDQFVPSVGMDRSGRFSVAYMSFSEEPDLGSEDIILRSYRADGTAWGPQVAVHPPDPFPDNYPSISQSDGGLIEVSWQSWQTPPEISAFDYDVMTRRFVLTCEEDAFTLCLNGGRFAVRAFWRNSAGREDLAAKIPLTSDTGGFYFFDPSNFELLVKVLDGCAINQRFWVFAAGLTDVEVDLLVTDTWTGQTTAFHNPGGQPFVPVREIGLFEGCAAVEPGPVARNAGRALSERPAQVAAKTAPSCNAGDTVLCLDQGRYRVTANWRDPVGQTGPAKARPQSDGSGLFSFFSPSNLELAVKVLDGCALNGRRWVFAAGLTDVAVTLRVEEVATATVWERNTPLGAPFPAILDLDAFSACLR